MLLNAMSGLDTIKTFWGNYRCNSFSLSLSLSLSLCKNRAIQAIAN